MREDQSLGAQTGKGGPGKAKLKLKKRKEKRRKTKSKKVKAGKKENTSKGGKGKHRKIKGKGTKSKKSKSKDKKKNEKKESLENEVARQADTTVMEDPDRYKHCDYLDLVEVGYREDSICKPGDKMVFKVNYLVAVKDFDGTHTGRKGNPKAVPYDTADKCCRLSRAGEESDILQ